MVHVDFDTCVLDWSENTKINQFDSFNSVFKLITSSWNWSEQKSKN